MFVPISMAGYLAGLLSANNGLFPFFFSEHRLFKVISWWFCFLIFCGVLLSKKNTQFFYFLFYFFSSCINFASLLKCRFTKSYTYTVIGLHILQGRLHRLQFVSATIAFSVLFVKKIISCLSGKKKTASTQARDLDL